jgi:hypothetical protein
MRSLGADLPALVRHDTEPHWKGPDMAAIIERAYRLKE